MLLSVLGRKYAGTLPIALNVQGEATGVSICGGMLVIGLDCVWVGVSGGGPASVSVGLPGGGAVSVGVGERLRKLQTVEHTASKTKTAILFKLDMDNPSR